MVLSYSKWDGLDDSDDEAESGAKPAAPGRDPAMDEVRNLGRDASVAQIQEKIKGMSAATRETLLRHEKGGLLKRVLELDPNRVYILSNYGDLLTHVRGDGHGGDKLYRRALALDPEHVRALEGQMRSCSSPSLVEALARQGQRLREWSPG